MPNAGPTAGLTAKDHKPSDVQSPALIGSSNIHASQATARPHFGPSLIDAADRAYQSDPAVRKGSNWI